MARTREEVRSALESIGLDVTASEKAGLLNVGDLQSATMGLEPSRGETIEDVKGETGEYMRVKSVKAADLSVEWLKGLKEAIAREDLLPPGTLNIGESVSTVLRFNEEKPYLEFLETRVLALDKKKGASNINAAIRGIHSEAFYKRFEAMFGGVIDLRVMEHEGEAKNFLRLRSLKGQPHDTRWHEIEVKTNGEAVLSS
jgi:KaiC/GvpD/RAD55 family RecA-like ATPase